VQEHFGPFGPLRMGRCCEGDAADGEGHWVMQTIGRHGRVTVVEVVGLGVRVYCGLEAPKGGGSVFHG
jgi:hypothetical protein